MIGKRALLSTTVLTIASIGFAGTAGAQVPTAPDPAEQQRSAAPDAVSIADIVVTAERRTSSVQKTPMAITAIGGESLRSTVTSGFEGLSTQVPNLQFERNSGDAMIFIRGIGYNSVSPGGDPRVALYSDGIYQSRTQAGLLGFYDVSRVEVLRGPQGTLYGRIYFAGTINIITNEPGSSLNGYFTGTVGTYRQIGTEGALGGPLADAVSARIAFRTADRNGYGRNVSTGEDVNDEHSRSVRGTIVFKPTTQAKITVAADYSKIDDHAGGSGYGGPGNFAIVPLGIVLGGPSAVPADPQDRAGFGHRERIETYGLSGQVDIELSPNTRVTALTGYRRFTSSLETNVDNSTLELTRNYINEKSDTFSQEVRLAQRIGRLADLTLGAYYFHEKNSALNLVPHKGITLQQPFSFGPGTFFDALTAPLDPDAYYVAYATSGRQSTKA